MQKLEITSLSRAQRIKRRNFDAVLTLEDVRCQKKNQLRFHTKPEPDHIIMRFEDIDDDEHEYAIATEADVESIIAFGRKHVQSNMLIHCFHGVGRSSAAALAILTDRLGNADSALKEVLAIRPESVPNLRVSRLADKVLRTDSAIIKALESWTNRTPHIAEFRQQKRAFFEANRDLYAKK